MNNGDVIIISVPALTEERRRDLAKQAKVEAEDAKVFEMRVKMPIQKLKNLKKTELRTFENCRG
jgi:ribosome recycling factor